VQSYCKSYEPQNKLTLFIFISCQYWNISLALQNFFSSSTEFKILRYKKRESRHEKNFKPDSGRKTQSHSLFSPFLLVIKEKIRIFAA